MNQVIAQPDATMLDPHEDQPLTERILARLPGPRWAKLATWIAVPVLRAVSVVMVLGLTGRNALGWGLGLMVVPEALVFTYAIMHAIWGAAKIARNARDLEPGLAELTLAGQEPSPRVFRGMGSTTGPILIALVISLFLLDVTVGTETWWAVLALLVFNVVIHLPITTLFWAYLMLMFGLNRLGTRHLALEAYGGDKSLGLRPVGKLAFTGFWVFAANLGPLLLIGLTYVGSLIVGLLVFIAGVFAFFLSLWRVHEQMSRARQHQLIQAQTLYEQAYEPLMTTHTLETFQERSGLLGAVEALERRAEAIQTWPFSDALLARIVVIGLSVITAIIARLVMKPLGL
jgi:hypothetical protein